jgi:hypothetical protein
VVEAQRREAEARERALRIKHAFSSVAQVFFTDKLAHEWRGKRAERDFRSVFIVAWGNRPISEISKLDVLDVHPMGFCRGRGKRMPATLLAIDERDRYLIEAARHFPGASDRETARRLPIALLRYREGAWRRTRVEALCRRDLRDG